MCQGNFSCFQWMPLFSLCQTITKSLYFCWKNFLQRKICDRSLCLYLSTIFFFFFKCSFLQFVHSNQTWKPGLIAHQKNHFLFPTKVNKMLTPEYFQQTLAPKLTLILDSRSLRATYMVGSLQRPKLTTTYIILNYEYMLASLEKRAWKIMCPPSFNTSHTNSNGIVKLLNSIGQAPKKQVGSRSWHHFWGIRSQKS